MQSRRLARHVRVELGGGAETVGVLEEIRERALRPALVGRQPSESPEVRVGVDRNYPELQVRGEQVSDQERARRLAHPALWTDERHNVRARDARLLPDSTLDLGLVAVAP